MLVNNLVLLLLFTSVVGGILILLIMMIFLHKARISNYRSLSFSTPYSDMPSNMQGSLSELGDIDEEVDSQVNEIIKPTFQNPLEKSVTKENDDISSVIDSKGRVVDDGSATAIGATTTGDGDGDGNVYVVDYSNIRVQKFDNQGDFISKWGTKGKADGQFGIME